MTFWVHQWTCGVLLFSTVVAQANGTFGGRIYEGLSATGKRDLLWKRVNTPYPSDLPTKSPGAWYMLGLITSDYLLGTFKTTSDEMPMESDCLGYQSRRKKLIHTYGSVAKVQFKITNNQHKYTGLFKSGGIGLARISLALTPDPDYVPGLGLKLFIDEKPSFNFQAMYRLEGQGTNSNPFENTFSNIIPDPTNLPFHLKLMLSAFKATVTSLKSHNSADGPQAATHLPLYEAAQFTSDGSKVDHPIAPYQIFFTPTQQAKPLIPTNSTQDMRVDLAAVPVGTPLYDIDVIDENEETPIRMGQVITESEFIASEFGDEQLFFKHARHRSPLGQQTVESETEVKEREDYQL